MVGLHNLHLKLTFFLSTRWHYTTTPLDCVVSWKLLVFGTVMFIIIRKVVGLVSHSIAIICTIFRLVYRGRMHQLWWEDAWAALALVADVVCLACIWIDEAISSWILAIAFTSVLWAARMSIIFSIIPVANHSGSKIHKQMTRLIAVSFACMWAALLVQKLSICKFHSCRLGKSVALSILTTDFTADVSLVAAPLHLLKNAGLSRSKKVLVQSAFCASLLITAITIPHSILLMLGTFNTTTLMFAHIKAALSLTVCNLLVIATFLYRVYSKDTSDPDQSNGIFTSVIMMGSSTDTLTSFSLQKGITSRQIRVQTRGMEG
ncbi:hypothetical protein DFJ58DRAFT_110900 [Suillus subalutaceus]|uniref:uncharacterized protein n=1 Tax=Suillus subalutaceus TaxID=48586 RepID=UPI001B86F384|nr:uncharacterized protein DFJ58DRAFT_110900 [Suillus subalutaceus]KAG1839117.1 hypothetical protein DFJ58DRAFT_110900 [Suillus subalutaceus]